MSSASGILIRPREGRVLGGVALAIANRFGWDVTLTRVATALAVVFTGFGLVVYIALWIVVPSGY